MKSLRAPGQGPFPAHVAGTWRGGLAPTVAGHVWGRSRPGDWCAGGLATPPLTCPPLCSCPAGDPRPWDCTCLISWGAPKLPLPSRQKVEGARATGAKEGGRPAVSWGPSAPQCAPRPGTDPAIPPALCAALARLTLSYSSWLKPLFHFISTRISRGPHPGMCSGAGHAGTRVCQHHAHTCELSLHTCTRTPYHTSSHQAAISGTAGLRQKGAPPLSTGAAPWATAAGPGPLHVLKAPGCPWHRRRSAHAWGVFAASSQLTLGSSGCLKAGGGRLGHGLAGTWIGQGTPPRAWLLKVGTRAVALGAWYPRVSSKSQA